MFFWFANVNDVIYARELGNCEYIFVECIRSFLTGENNVRFEKKNPNLLLTYKSSGDGRTLLSSLSQKRPFLSP